jgi:hypothetical protein
VTLGGAVVAVPGSDVHDMPLLWPFQASANTVKDTTEELRNISNKATQLHPAPSNSREAPPGDHNHGRR